MLANLAYTLPFLGEGGVHLPYPQDPTVRSRQGGWAYPGETVGSLSPDCSFVPQSNGFARHAADMLEVGNLANATEDRSHFSA